MRRSPSSVTVGVGGVVLLERAEGVVDVAVVGFVRADREKDVPHHRVGCTRDRASEPTGTGERERAKGNGNGPVSKQ